MGKCERLRDLSCKVQKVRELKNMLIAEKERNMVSTLFIEKIQEESMRRLNFTLGPARADVLFCYYSFMDPTTLEEVGPQVDKYPFVCSSVNAFSV